MKIAFIGHKRIPSNEGGVEKVVEQQATRMVERSHKVVAYNRGGHNVFGKEYDNKKRKEYKGIRIITVPTTKGSSSVPIYSFLATMHAVFARYDCISYNASGSCAMIPLAKLFRLRTVALLHGIDSKRDKWGGFASKYLAFGEKMAAKKADVCLVLSENMRQYIKDTYGANSITFANGIDKPKLLEPNAIREYGLEKNNYILSLGRIVPEKGIHYLIQTFRKCDTEKKLIIAGGAEANKEYYDSLREMAQGDDRIIFTGFVRGDTIAELYSNAYLFALPSNLEGMACALLEAMSFSNCCLVSDIPENTEVVEDRAEWFKKGDVEDLYNKLSYLLDNEDVVKAYKEQAQEFILNRYNWETVVDQMLRVFSGDAADYYTVVKEKQTGDRHED